MPVLYLYLLNVRYGKQVHRLRDISALRCALENVALSQAAYDSSAPDSDRDSRGSSTDRKSRASMQSAVKASTSFWTWIVRAVCRRFGNHKKRKMSEASKAMMGEHAEKISLLEAEEAADRAKLPGFVAKLVAGYELKVFWVSASQMADVESCVEHVNTGTPKSVF